MLSDKYSLRFGEVSSADYGIYIFGGGAYNKPQRRVTKYTIPGRSGDLTIDEGAFDNVTVKYQAIVTDEFGDRFNAFMAAMYSQTGYQRLTDAFDDDHFRQALFCGALKPDVGVNAEYGTFEMEFDCKPQRWLKSGDEWKELDVEAAKKCSAIINNPTFYDTKPIIRTWGNGLYNQGAGRLYISGYEGHGYDTDYLETDCETEETISGIDGGSANKYVSTNGFRYPTIYAKRFNKIDNSFASEIRIEGDITAVTYKPRWWEL